MRFSFVVARAVADRRHLVADLGGVLVEAGGAGARRRGELDGPEPVLRLDLQHGVRVADEDFLDRAGQARTVSSSVHDQP